MLRNLQPDVFQKKARSELEEIKHSLKLLDFISQELDSLSGGNQRTEREIQLDKSEKLKIDIREKLKSIGLNINEMISVLDYKITILCRQLTKLQNMNKNSSPKGLQKKYSVKSQEQYKYQINQLEDRIFQLQKRQNEYVKQMSELKEKNAKLREQFSNLSLDSNQRIRQLSEKLHNNTSPNLTIKRVNVTNNPQMSYMANFEQNEKKKLKNNFVKIKGANSFERERSPLEMSPNTQSKKNKNMLDSLTSQSSEYDIKGLGYEIPENEQNSGILKFGCFPGKQISEKTKTGSTSQNKKITIEQRCDKSRRFEFLLNNLIDKPSQQQQAFSYQTANDFNFKGNHQPINEYQYKSIRKPFAGQQCKSVFNQNVIKRYQI